MIKSQFSSLSTMVLTPGGKSGKQCGIWLQSYPSLGWGTWGIDITSPISCWRLLLQVLIPWQLQSLHVGRGTFQCFREAATGSWKSAYTLWSDKGPGFGHGTHCFFLIANILKAGSFYENMWISGSLRKKCEDLAKVGWHSHLAAPSWPCPL